MSHADADTVRWLPLALEEGMDMNSGFDIDVVDVHCGEVK